MPYNLAVGTALQLGEGAPHSGQDPRGCGALGPAAFNPGLGFRCFSSCTTERCFQLPTPYFPIKGESRQDPRNPPPCPGCWGPCGGRPEARSGPAPPRPLPSPGGRCRARDRYPARAASRLVRRAAPSGPREGSGLGPGRAGPGGRWGPPREPSPSRRRGAGSAGPISLPGASRRAEAPGRPAGKRPPPPPAAR